MIRLKNSSFKRFVNGVISAVSPSSQPVASVPHAINFLFDKELDSATRRKGLTEIGDAVSATNPILGLHNHRGTNDFALAAASDGTNNDIYKSIGGDWTKSLADDTKDLETDFAQFLDTTIRVNGTDQVKSTEDASSWDTAAAPGTGNLDIGNMPNGTLLQVYKQRLQVIEGSTVYISSTPLATLAYDGQGATNFTVGSTLEGGTSDATGVIFSDTDAGATGTLELANVSGIFVTNETITDDETGSATSNGTSDYKISWTSGNKENLQVSPADGSDIIATGVTGGIEGIELFLKDNGIYRYNGSFLDPKPFTSIGCTSKNSIANFNNGIGFANQDAYWFTNGQGVPIPLTTPVQDWWDNMAAGHAVAAYSNDKILLISIGDITKKDTNGKAKTYNNVCLYKSLTSDNWAILTFSEEFNHFTKYFDSGNQEIWGGTTIGKVHEVFNGTSDNATPIFYELELPQIVGEDIQSTKSLSESIGVYGKALKGAKVYISVDGAKWSDSLGALEEDITLLKINKYEGNYFKFKISNYQTGAPVIIREVVISHIETSGESGSISNEQRYGK